MTSVNRLVHLPFFYLNLLSAMIRSVHVNVVILILGEDPSFGYYATAPMYDVAFERAALLYPALYPNTTRHVLYQKNVRDCASAAANMVDVAGKMMDLVDHQDGFTVLMSPGCSAEEMVLGDFAREMNVLLLASTSADLAFTNKQRFPTFITFGPVGRGASVPALKAFLELYALTTFTVFCETTSNYLNVASFFSLICRAIRSIIMTSRQFTVYLQEIDSVRKPDYRNMVLRAKNQSRVIVLETRDDIARKIMIAAHLENMTNGDFVFFFLQQNPLPQHVDLMEPTDDVNDQMVKDAYRALILLQYDTIKWDRSALIFQKAARIALSKYNYSYHEDEKHNDHALSAYEATTILFQVLDEVSSSSDQTFNTRRLYGSILNRTFPLESRDVSIEPVGYRLADVAFKRYSTQSTVFETAWIYDALRKQILVLSSNFSSSWYKRPFPPPNVPQCGYREDLCFNDQLQQRTTIVVTVGVLLVLLLLLMSVVMLYRRSRTTPLGNTWWIINMDQYRRSGHYSGVSATSKSIQKSVYSHIYVTL